MKSKIFGIYVFFAGLSAQLMGINVWPTSPVTISTPEVNAESPQIAVDPSGNQVAVWIENQLIVSKTCEIGGVWGAIDYLSTSGSTSPQIVIDPNAKATVVWLNGGIIFSSEKTLRGSWSDPEPLTEIGASDYQIAIDPSGNIVIAWIERGVLQVKTKPVDTIWSAVATVVSQSGAQTPDVAIGGNLIVAVWEGSDQAIYSSEAIFGASWSTPVKISDQNILTCNPSVAVNTSAEAFAGWFRFNQNGSHFSNGYVQAAIGSDGVWAPAQDISDLNTPIIVDPHELQLAVKSYTSNSAITAWTSSYDGSCYNVEWVLFKDGSWDVSTILVSNPTPTTFGLAVDWRNYAYLVSNYLDPSDGILKMYGGLLNLTTPKDIPVSQSIFPWLFCSTGNSCCNDISAALSSHAAPVINSPAGMVWENWDGNVIAIQNLQVFIPRINPPTNLQVKMMSEDYGVFLQYNNEVTWSPSTSKIVSGYVIFRNGIYLAEMSKTTLSYIDLNQGNLSGTYTIFSITDYGWASVGAEINFP